MNHLLIALAKNLNNYDLEASLQVAKLAGRYDKAPINNPIIMQPAFKYIMYLKLMRGIPNAIFHQMKRKYLNTSIEVQEECRKELDELVHQDSLKYGISSTEILKDFDNRLNSPELIKNILKS